MQIPYPEARESCLRFTVNCGKGVNSPPSSCKDRKQCAEGCAISYFPPVMKPVGRQDIREATIDAYNKIRQELVKRYCHDYVDESGKIKDQALLAIIITGEFGGKRGYVYQESLEAVSREYNDGITVSPSTAPCGGRGNCTLDNQLIWLDMVESVRRQRNSLDFYFAGNKWENYLTDASAAMSPGFLAGNKRNSWIWGNVDKKSEMNGWLDSGQGKGEVNGCKYIAGDSKDNYVVLTSGQNCRMRANCWHWHENGPYWGQNYPCTKTDDKHCSQP